MSTTTGKTTPCPACRNNGQDRAGDNLVWYVDGSAHCFACDYDHQPTKGKRVEQEEEPISMTTFSEVATFPIVALSTRGIDEKSAAAFGVRTECNLQTGKPERYYFPLYKGGELVGYQSKEATKSGGRTANSTTRVYADANNRSAGALPFGAHAAGNGGRFLIVTEGGEDCLATYQMLASLGKRYRCVATLGTQHWKQNLEYFEKFDKVVIAFDQDDAGQKAATAFAEALSPGKAAILTWDGAEHGTDPNELLVGRKAKLFMDSINNAKPVANTSIITGEAAWDIIRDYTAPESIPYPPEWSVLNEKMGGMRAGEISLWTAGTSVGKSLMVRRLKQHIIQNTNWKVGDVELEETVEKTIRAMLQFQGKKPLVSMSMEEKRAAWEATYGTKRLFTLNHRSQYSKGQSLLGKMKHLHYAMGCRFIALDHLSLMQCEWGEGHEGLTQQSRMMSDFLQFVEETGVHLCLISHLRKSVAGAKSFETGAVPTLDDLIGSSSVKQISFDAIALSRNTKAQDDVERNTTQFTVLKVRENGNTGPADRMLFDRESMTFSRAPDPIEEEEF